jgi:uncharacterized membrane protein
MVWDALGRLHPFFVHFPVALILTAFAVEVCAVARRDEQLGDAARILITAAAWCSIPAAVAGFARVGAAHLGPELHATLVVHRIAGIATPVLAFLAAGLVAGVRRSGQIWELFLYRAVLLLAAIAAAVAGHHGGELVYGVGFFPLW